MQVTYPTDGSPWGIHITGPYPDGVTYLLSYMSGRSTIGPVDKLPKPDTSMMSAWAYLSTKPGSLTGDRGAVPATLTWKLLSLTH